MDDMMGMLRRIQGQLTMMSMDIDEIKERLDEMNEKRDDDNDSDDDDPLETPAYKRYMQRIKNINPEELDEFDKGLIDMDAQLRVQREEIRALLDKNNADCDEL